MQARLVAAAVSTALLVSLPVLSSSPSSAAPASGGAAAVTGAAIQPPGLDHFNCYTLNPKTTTPTQGPPFVTLIDQFAQRGVKVAKKPSQICVPTKKFRPDNGEVTPVNNFDANLLCYAVRSSAPDPIRRVVVINQFGDAQLQIGQPTRLCLPTRILTAGTPGDIPKGLDHFLCYQARVELSTTGKPVNDFESRPPYVVLTDRWVTSTRKIGKVAELCNPVEKIRPDRPEEHNPITNPEAHQVCFQINPLDVVRSEDIVNQFGKGHITTAQSKWLCLPSYKRLLDPPPPGARV